MLINIFFISGMQFYSALAFNIALGINHEELKSNKTTQPNNIQVYKELSHSKRWFIQEEEFYEIFYDSIESTNSDSEITTEEDYTSFTTESEIDGKENSTTGFNTASDIFTEVNYTLGFTRESDIVTEENFTFGFTEESEINTEKNYTINVTTESEFVPKENISIDITTESEIFSEDNYTLGFNEDTTSTRLTGNYAPETIQSKDKISENIINGEQKYKFPIFNVNVLTALKSLLKIVSSA